MIILETKYTWGVERIVGVGSAADAAAVGQADRQSDKHLWNIYRVQYNNGIVVVVVVKWIMQMIK